MITKFDTYLNENKKLLSDDEMINYLTKYYDFFKEYFKDNNFIKIREYDTTICIENIGDGTALMILQLTLEYNNKMTIYKINNHIKYKIDSFDDNIQNIILYFENFYDIFEKYLNKNNLRFEHIPIVNINGFIDFIYDIVNNSNNKVLYSYYKDGILNHFIDEVYDNDYYLPIKDKLYDKFHHLINAKNFDLL